MPGIKYKTPMFRSGSHPPRNKVVISVHIKIILMFSPRKNCAKVIAEYSTK